MAADKKASQEQQVTYVGLTGLFWLIFAIFNLLNHRKLSKFEVRPLDFALLGLSVFRLGRLVAYDIVTSPYRAPFAKTVSDATGAGDSVEPKGRGWRRAIGELISCPICAGTWIGAALVYALQIAPGPARLFITIMGAIGLGEVLNAITEALTWNAQTAREQAGQYARNRSKQG